MRSSASSWLRQVLHAPLQKLTTTTSPRCSEMRTFSPVRPRATRSGAGWPSSSYFSAAAAATPARREGERQRKRSKTRCGAALERTNKQAVTVGSTLGGTPDKRNRIRREMTRETLA